ncbi:MAG: YceG family protein [Terrisporobacter sp.]|uniref:YceG family protein n=1 Tax=Terrisporobacter sp. TaxID=1965305 RepID=UPI003A9E4D37
MEVNFKNNGDSYFYRFIGINDTKKYNDELKTLQFKSSELENTCLIFDNEVPLSGEMELIQYIYNELQTMNINDMINQDITIFDDYQVNNKFLEALQYVVNLGICNENFFNDNVRNNFITKVIVWAYTYAKSIDFTKEYNPMCIYYGKIEKHEIYFLILLYKMGFDTIYINPLKEEYIEEIDKDKLSICKKSMQIGAIESFNERCEKGNVIENVETITKQIQREIHEDIFVNTGIFKPWQFRNGFSKSVLLDTIVEDIYIYYNEPAKLRDGFEVQGDVVKVPTFFYKIDGEYTDRAEYIKLVSHCLESYSLSNSNTLFIDDGNISSDEDLNDDMYQLMFCQLSDGTFDIEEIKKLDIYKFKKYNEVLQNFLLNKFNEVIKRDDLFVKKLDKDSCLKLLVLVLNLDKNIIRIVDNFDFVYNIPKIVIFLNKEDILSDNMIMLLAYLHNIGIDIIIFNPSGMCNLSNIIRNDKFNLVRLQKISYETTYNKLILSLAKPSVFTKLFKNK